MGNRCTPRHRASLRISEMQRRPRRRRCDSNEQGTHRRTRTQDHGQDRELHALREGWETAEKLMPIRESARAREGRKREVESEFWRSHALAPSRFYALHLTEPRLQNGAM